MKERECAEDEENPWQTEAMRAYKYYMSPTPLPEGLKVVATCGEEEEEQESEKVVGAEPELGVVKKEVLQEEVEAPQLKTRDVEDDWVVVEENDGDVNKSKGKPHLMATTRKCLQT